MIKEKVQECMDIFNEYYWKDYNFYDKENNQIIERNIYFKNIEVEFYRVSQSIIIMNDIFSDNRDYYLYTRKDYKNNSIEFEFNVYDLTIIFSILDGNITENKIKNLPDNIFDWTEEDLFYLELKYGR